MHEMLPRHSPCFCGANLRLADVASFPRSIPTEGSMVRIFFNLSGTCHSYTTGILLLLNIFRSRQLEAPMQVGLRYRVLSTTR